MRTAQTSFAVFWMAIVWSIAAPAAGAGYAPSAPFVHKRIPGAEIFDNKTVLAMRIEVSSNELSVLRQNDRKDVRATVYEGTNLWRDVGLHVKGAAGSRRDINDKPALTLNFGKFTPEQRFHGLRKIHLNNSVQDGTYLSENICSELYRRAGVHTPRVTYATLELNGRKKGFYVVKEGFTKDLLGMYFKNKNGNLYDGGFLREITEQLERDIDGDGDVRDWSDLKALVKAANEPDLEKRFDGMSKLLDVDRFITYSTLQIMTWDWDGYVMNRNNYRVYHDLGTGKMVFFPHGMDQMFADQDPTGAMMPRDKFNGLVARAIMETPQARQLYRERFGQVFTNIFQIETLTNRVNELAALVSPHVGNRNDYSNQVRQIRDLIVRRYERIENRLGMPELKPMIFADGSAAITNWAIPTRPTDPAKAIRDRAELDGRTALHILTTNKTTNTAASWRANVLLAPGNYRFEAMVKCVGVVPAVNLKKGEGAGIRYSGTTTNRPNRLIGDAPWQKLQYDLPPSKFEREWELICELRAYEGEAWFDVNSLRLIRLSDEPAAKVLSKDFPNPSADQK